MIPRGGNRVVLIVQIDEVRPPESFLHNRRVCNAQVSIPGGLQRRPEGEMVRASRAPLLLEAWNAEADKLAVMKPFEFVRAEGFLSNNEFFDSDGIKHNMIRLRCLRVDTYTNVGAPTEFS